MMAAFERMRERLSKVGVYGDDAQVLCWELKVYATEIERLYSELGVLFRERFITTAEDIGLSAYEKIFGPEREEESTEERRRLLLLRLNLGNGDFTVDGFQKGAGQLWAELYDQRVSRDRQDERDLDDELFSCRAGVDQTRGIKDRSRSYRIPAFVQHDDMGALGRAGQDLRHL